jgi:hypothetical protein
MQKYPENLDSYSRILSELSVSKNNGKFCIDSAWESGDIYYCDYDSGLVKKIAYDGTELATLQLSRPTIVSVIQYGVQMQREITYPPQQDKGCWVVDDGTDKIIKIDNQLNVLYELVGVSDITALAADVDDGCYFADNNTQTLAKISSTGIVLAVRLYSDFSPTVTRVDEIRPYQRVTDMEAWVLAHSKVYGMRYANGIIDQWTGTPVDPIDDLISESIEGDQVGSIDVDRNTNYLYVSGGDSYSGWIAKYTQSPTLIGSAIYQDIAFPYVLKVVQGYGSNAVYVLADPSKWDDLGYGSSSSSTASSMSSSSSSSSSIDSSSSSSYGLSSSSSSSSSSSLEYSISSSSSSQSV